MATKSQPHQMTGTRNASQMHLHSYTQCSQAGIHIYIHTQRCSCTQIEPNPCWQHSTANQCMGNALPLPPCLLAQTKVKKCVAQPTNYTYTHTDTHRRTASWAENGECVELIGGKQKDEKKTLTHNGRCMREATELGAELLQLDAGWDVDHNNTKVKLVENANANKKRKANAAKNGTRKYRHSCLIYSQQQIDRERNKE